MKRKMIAMLLSLAMVGSMLTGCSVSTGSSDDDKKTEDDAKGEESADAEDGTVTKSDPNMKDREEINMWFWGAEPYAQEAMQEILVTSTMLRRTSISSVIEFRPSVDTDMSTALAANQGPDIVYGSGPSFVMPLVEAGKLEAWTRTQGVWMGGQNSAAIL